MKYLLLTLSLVTVTANADTFYSRMENGATLVLTTDKNECIYGHSGFTMSITGKVSLTNCWEVTGKNVKVYYSDGDTREYPITSFFMVDKKDEVRL